VGWFNPAAAETMFLSSSYCRPLHANEEGFVDDTCVNGFEILDWDWQQGSVTEPLKPIWMPPLGLCTLLGVLLFGMPLRDSMEALGKRLPSPRMILVLPWVGSKGRMRGLSLHRPSGR
jgi:hypothetical protein